MRLGRVRHAANVVHGLVGAVSVHTNTFTVRATVSAGVTRSATRPQSFAIGQPWPSQPWCSGRSMRWPLQIANASAAQNRQLAP